MEHLTKKENEELNALIDRYYEAERAGDVREMNRIDYIVATKYRTNMGW